MLGQQERRSRTRASVDERERAYEPSIERDGPRGQHQILSLTKRLGHESEQHSPVTMALYIPGIVLGSREVVEGVVEYVSVAPAPSFRCVASAMTGTWLF